MSRRGSAQAVWNITEEHVRTDLILVDSEEEDPRAIALSGKKAENLIMDEVLDLGQ